MNIERFHTPPSINDTIPAPEIVTDEDILRISYERSGVRDLLYKFAFRLPLSETDDLIVNEGDLDEALAAYAVDTAHIATKTDGPDIPLIQKAFDAIIDDMNGIANEKLGYKEPQTITQRLLLKAGVKKPEPRTYFAGLTGKYWSEQFPKEYAVGSGVRRAEGETEEKYLARRIHYTFHGFALAPFSYI